MANISPFEFLQQVRAEASKVVWPSRRETLVTTMMVVVDGGVRLGVLSACPTRLSAASSALF